MHYSRAVFFPCFGSICGICHLLTTFKRGCINTEVFAKWTWILQDITESKNRKMDLIPTIRGEPHRSRGEQSFIGGFISGWWIWEKHCPFFSLGLLVVNQKWWYWLLWIALKTVDKLWYVRMSKYCSPGLYGRNSAALKEAEQVPFWQWFKSKQPFLPSSLYLC